MEHNNEAFLVGSYGGDTTHTLAAWASTFEELNMEMPLDVDDRIDAVMDYILTNHKKVKTPEELLNFLATHNHGSPFEFSFLHFMIKEDYKSHIHALKHRIGHGLNTESTRYKERVEDKFLIPDDIDIPISSPLLRHLGLQETSTVRQAMQNYTELGNGLYHASIDALSEPLGRKRAKEVSAYFLTLNNQVYAHEHFNFRSFVQFQYLRNSKHAQKEIRELADMMLSEVKATGKFNASLKAFGLA